VARTQEKTGFDGLGFKIRYDEEKDGHYIDQVKYNTRVVKL